MTVKEIIAIAFGFAGERGLEQKLTNSSTLTTVEEEKVNSMLKYFNYIREEIATDYLPLKMSEKIDVCNSTLSFSQLSQKLISIYALRGKYGKLVRYKKYPDYIEIYGHATKIVYSYVPENLGIDDEVELQNGLTERVLAYGLASEYLLCDGLGNEAEVWEERFKTSLFMLSHKHTEMLLPRREWF